MIKLLILKDCQPIVHPLSPFIEGGVESDEETGVCAIAESIQVTFIVTTGKSF